MKSKKMLIIFILFSFILIGCKDKAKKVEEQSNVFNVMTIKLMSKKLTPKITLSGWVEPFYDIKLASELGGNVEEIFFSEGMQVKKGDVIAYVNLEFLKTSLSQAKSSLDMAKAKYERQKKLFERKLISDEQMEEFETALKVSDENFNMANINFEKGKIVSPIDGVLDSLDIDKGEVLVPFQNIGRIINIDNVYVLSSFPEKDILKINQNDSVSVKSSVFEEILSGKIHYVALASNEFAKTFKVKIIVENKNYKLRPGMLVNVEYMLPEIENALSIPQSSITQVKGRKSVYVLEEGFAREKEIQTGITFSNKVQILSGLKEGDSIIVFGHQNLIDGDKVNEIMKQENMEI